MSLKDEKNRTVEAQFTGFKAYLEADLPAGEELDAAILQLAECQSYAHMAVASLPDPEPETEVSDG